MNTKQQKTNGLTIFLLTFLISQFILMRFGASLGEIHEAICRNWLLTAVFSLMAINNSNIIKKFWKKLLITIPIFFFVVSTQAYITYEYFGYDNQTEIGFVVTGLGLALVSSIAFGASFLAKRFDPDFSIFHEQSKRHSCDAVNK